MRRNVVLPQPLGPTSEMNWPRSTDRSMPRSASRSPNDLLSRATASFAMAGPALIPRPRHEPAFQPAEAGGHHDAGERQDNDAGKQVRHVEGVGRLTDQVAEPGTRAEQLRDHDAD